MRSGFVLTGLVADGPFRTWFGVAVELSVADTAGLAGRAVDPPAGPCPLTCDVNAGTLDVASSARVLRPSSLERAV